MERKKKCIYGALGLVVLQVGCVLMFTWLRNETLFVPYSFSQSQRYNRIVKKFKNITALYSNKISASRNATNQPAKSRLKFKHYDPLKPQVFTLPSSAKINASRNGCHKDGTAMLLQNNSCVCKPDWYGAQCDIPDVVYHSDLNIHNLHKTLTRRDTPRRILNAINVNHESDFLEIRIHELWDLIDVFIICESNYTAFGSAKDLSMLSLLKDGFLSDYQDKIMYVFLDHFPPGGREDGWIAQRYLRTFLGKQSLKQIKGIQPDDVFILSDADEIPHRKAVWFLKNYDGYPEPIGFWLRWSYYGFFWSGPLSNGLPHHTHIAGAVTTSFLREAYGNDLARMREKTLDAISKTTYQTHNVQLWHIGLPQGPFAGWHCSWCFTPEGIKIKLISAQNGDYPRWGSIPEKTDLGYIRTLIRDGRYFDGLKKFSFQTTSEADSFYAPEYVLKNKEKFLYLIKNPYQ